MSSAIPVFPALATGVPKLVMLCFFNLESRSRLSWMCFFNSRIFSRLNGSPSSASARRCLLFKQNDSHLSARSEGVRLYIRRIERTSARRGAESGDKREDGKYSSSPSRREGSKESAGMSAIAIAMLNCCQGEDERW